MLSINQATVAGNLCADPKTGTLKDGRKWAAFRVAVNSRYKRADGTRYDPDFIPVIAFDRTDKGGLATNIGKYLEKGRLVHVEGRLQRRVTTTEDGKTYDVMEIVARDVQFVDGPKSDGSEIPPPDIDETAEPVAAGQETDEALPY